MNTEAKKELSELVDSMTDLSQKRHTLYREIQKIRDKISIIHAKLVIDIGRAKDDKGKPVYSNEKLREAALTLSLNENEEYQRLKEKMRELDYEDTELDIEYHKLVDRRLLLLAELGLANPTSTDSK
jgi:hypothetical protein